MSWLFSQALVEAYSVANCLDGVPSAQLNVMPTPHPFWLKDKTMEPSRFSRFGLTSLLLTADLGEGLLTWFRAASPAKTSAQLVKAQGLTENAPDSGKRWSGSFAKLDLLSCSWKTAQYSLLGGLELYSETWPRWGTMRSGECWERQTWERLTSETECGLLPTPLASIATHGGPKQRDSSGRPGLQMAAMSWPTPQAHDATKGNPNRVGRYGTKHGGRNLNDWVAKWPTPAARDWRHPNKQPYSERGGGAKGEQLPNAVGGALNPDWVEWLMGWPIGWTDLEPLGMDRYHAVPLKLSCG